MEFNAEKHIVIGDKIYARDSFNEEQQRMISMVNFADQEVATMEHNLAIYKFGRDQMVRELVEQLKEVEHLGEVPAQEAE